MKLIDQYRLAMKSVNLIVDLKFDNIPKLIKFYKTYMRYRNLENAEEVNACDIHPFINDDSMTTSFHGHYFYQGV